MRLRSQRWCERAVDVIYDETTKLTRKDAHHERCRRIGQWLKQHFRNVIRYRHTQLCLGFFQKAGLKARLRSHTGTKIRMRAPMKSMKREGRRAGRRQLEKRRRLAVTHTNTMQRCSFMTRSSKGQQTATSQRIVLVQLLNVQLSWLLVARVGRRWPTTQSMNARLYNQTGVSQRQPGRVATTTAVTTQRRRRRRRRHDTTKDETTRDARHKGRYVTHMV